MSMLPHELLTADHQALHLQMQSLAAQVEKGDARIPDTLAALETACEKHFRREEPYYRVLDEGKRIEDRALMHQLRNDHAAVIFTLESLVIRYRKNGLNPEWRAKWDALQKLFMSHLDVEGNKVFPMGSKVLTAAQSEQLAREIENVQ